MEESKIKKAREAAGLSRAEFSRRTGIPLRNIENWESGRVKKDKWFEDMLIREIDRVKEEDDQERP